MASPASASNPHSRPSPQRTASHPLEPTSDDDYHPPPKPVRKAHTFQDSATLPSHPPVNPSSAAPPGPPDAFETNEDSSDNDAENDATRKSIELDELPIELITLTDSFVGSLSAKVHPAPPNIEKLSHRFQDFYATASSHVAAHVGALASKKSRDVSPAPSASSFSSAASRLRGKAASPLSNKDGQGINAGGQQMITAEELAEKKKAKKGWDAKRGLLEEAVERRLCEGIYDRIYRHRSTQDEAQDAKLRSKTAALALVGISPADLGIDLGTELTGEVVQQIQQRLEPARTEVVSMHESRYPLGKLNHLKAAHRSVVDTLAHFQPSASADEIMPMLIFTLITLPPESIHVISDLQFIQRFRWEPKLTGEAAYCLTNLEAVISFLQTVDLTTLRADESHAGPAKTPSDSGTPKTETFPPAYPRALSSVAPAGTSVPAVTASKAPASTLKPNNPLRTRRLSDLVNTPAQAFGAASDAVFSTADQGIKTISTSLEGSYKFLLGKMRERQQGPKDTITVPRTLDDARKLISTPPPSEYEEPVSGASSTLAPEDAQDALSSKRTGAMEDRVISMISGRRDRSTDSRQSSSSRKVSSINDEKAQVPQQQQQQQQQQNPAVLEQMRQLGNTFNPMARLSSISGGFRGFGRSAASPAPSVTKETKPADGGDLSAAFPDIAAALPPKHVTKIAPPNKHFMEMRGPGDLKLSEVVDLLKDYRRLAAALKNMGAFEDQ